ncbi:MAG: nitroreductase family protein [Clostridia bacterium]|nr:nitroreductase family protein [Clostridia bacterium]
MFELKLEKSWYDALHQRSSVRTYTGAPDKEQLDRLGVLCRKLSWQGVTIRMFKGPGLRGQIKGTNVYAVIVAKQGTPMEMEGFMGEALVLEATAMGLGTCWLGAGFYPDIISRNVNLQNDEAVHCVIAIGKCSLPKFAPKRRELVKVCGKNEVELSELGVWQKDAVLCARLAPSAINMQPWKIEAEKTGVSILETSVLYKKYAPLDRGIAMLHAAVGAYHAGREAVWKKVDGGWQMRA